jgi:Fucose permease
MNTENKIYKFLYILSFGVMLMMGLIDSMRGPIIPNIRTGFNINYTSVGTMLFIASLGFLVSTFVSGLLCDRFGQKKVLFFGFICSMAGILTIGISPNFGAFLAAMGLLNIGLGSVEMGVNSVVSGAVLKKQAMFMNFLHFFYGLGASIGPRYSGILLNMNVSWRRIYLFSLIFVGMLFIYLITLKFPENLKHGKSEPLSMLVIMKDKKALLFGAALGLYVSCETGMGNWLTNYLTVEYKMDGLKSSFYLSLFFIVFTIGRLIGGFIAEKLGYLNSVLLFFTVSLLLFSAGMLLGERYVVLFSICGFFFSIIYPTIVSTTFGEYKKATASVLGFVVTMGSGLNMLSNWLIGRLNDLFGVRAGFGVIIVYMAAAITIVIILRGMTGQANVENEKAVESI